MKVKERLLLTAAFKSFDIPEKLTVADWACKNRVIANNSPKPGRYSYHDFPYQKEPQDAITDESVEAIVLMWGARIGKTMCIDNAQGYFIEHDPQKQIIVYPSLDAASKWSKQFFMPMVRATPVLKNLIKDKKGDNTMLQKWYPGGPLTAIGAQTGDGVRQIEGSKLFMDEIDSYPNENEQEGSFITRAFKRVSTHGKNRSIVLASTPTLKGSSNIHDWFLKGDQREWFVKCPHCGIEHTLELKNLIVLDEESPENAYMQCDKGCVWTDDDRRTAVKAGYWKPMINTKRNIRSYHINSFCTMFATVKGYKDKIHEFAQEYIDAKKNKNDLRAFYNTFLGLPFEDLDSKVDHNTLYVRREDFNAIPLDFSIVTCGVDVQDDRLEALCVGWGKNGESWILEAKKFMGPPSGPDVWRYLREYLMAVKFKNSLGMDLHLDRVLIDEGGHFPKQVRDFVKRMPNWYHCKGRGGNDVKTVFQMSTTKNLKKLVLVGSNLIKGEFYRRLNLNPGEFGYVHLPQHIIDIKFYEQLVCEIMKIKYDYKSGQYYALYEKPNPHSRNEALDMYVYAYAGYESLGGSADKAWDNQCNRYEKEKKELETVKNNEPEVKALVEIIKDPVSENKTVSSLKPKPRFTIRNNIY